MGGGQFRRRRGRGAPSRFTLGRQENLSIYHDRLKMIITGAGSKYQPELATIMAKADGVMTAVPRSRQLRMSDELDRLENEPERRRFREPRLYRY